MQPPHRAPTGNTGTAGQTSKPVLPAEVSFLR